MTCYKTKQAFASQSSVAANLCWYSTHLPSRTHSQHRIYWGVEPLRVSSQTCMRQIWTAGHGPPSQEIVVCLENNGWGSRYQIWRTWMNKMRCWEIYQFSITFYPLLKSRTQFRRSKSWSILTIFRCFDERLRPPDPPGPVGPAGWAGPVGEANLEAPTCWMTRHDS